MIENVGRDKVVIAIGNRVIGGTLRCPNSFMGCNHPTEVLGGGAKKERECQERHM